MADDKKTQLGTGTIPARSSSSPPPSGVVVTPVSPSGTYSTPQSMEPLQTAPLATPAPNVATPAPSAAPLATPAPGAGPLATQPGAPATGALAVPTNVPTAAMAAAYNEDPLVGKTLVGRYHIARKLGEGGMGTVYLASHIVLEKQVALKVLHGEYARKPDLVERFMQEAKAASRIRHENVIDISDFGVTEDGFVFFAMELLKGNDLHELVARARLDGQVLPWDRSRHIFLQICAALAAAHSHGIVHRDLKPENVYLIEFLGHPDFVKLLDFGIAKLSEGGEGGEQRKLTRTGMLFGTPEYMSPEQARGDKVDHRVDIYAMACILFQLLTGRVPFEAENFMGVLSLHLTEPAPEIPLASLERCGAPPELAAIVARGLAKKPDDRWQTITEMSNAIRALHGELTDRPMTIPPAPTTAPPTTPPVDPRSRTHWTGKLEIPGADAAPAPRRGKLPLIIGGIVLTAGAAVAVVMATRSSGPSPAAPPVIAAPGSGGDLAPAPGDGVPPGVAATPPVELPPEAPPPAPLPEKVTIQFKLAKGVTLYDPEGNKVGEGGRKGKTVDVELPGSTSSLEYSAQIGKARERVAVTVFPDRNDTVEVNSDMVGSTGVSGGGRTPTTSPGTPTTSPGTPGTPGTAVVTPGTGSGSGSATVPSEPPPGDKPDKAATPPGDKPAEEEDDPLDPVLKGFDKGKDAAKDGAKDEPKDTPPKTP